MTCEKFTDDRQQWKVMLLPHMDHWSRWAKNLSRLGLLKSSPTSYFVWKYKKCAIML